MQPALVATGEADAWIVQATDAIAESLPARSV
jgi:hypothetical protein